MSKIIIVDYGVGNLRSVFQALHRAAPEANISISSRVTDIQTADRIVLPGQGAISDCMHNLSESGLQEALVLASRYKPLLGICVGQQILFDWSEEGNTAGLGLLPGKILRFKLAGQLQSDGSPYRIPQMGWNRVRQTVSHPLWQQIANNAYFYFAHSYYVQPSNAVHIAGETVYGQPFACAIAHDNIFATQFHPEKSAHTGLQLYRNFVHWNP